MHPARRHHSHRPYRRLYRRLAAWVLPLALAACGGGGGGAGDPTPPATSCSVADQKAWLADYMDEWYFWYRIAPRPDPARYATVASFFGASLYAGTPTTIPFPADRWSGYQSTESFNRFFGDGATLGYGVAVSGIEADGDPARKLWVRYVEPGSPAAAGGVQRGDEIIAVNGTPVATVIAGDDYGALSAGQAGDRLTLMLRRGGANRTVALTAAVFSLSPVQGAAVITSPGGRRLGYLQVKDMIGQALAPIDAAFGQFKAAGVQDVVLDLRYNGGGLVSTGGTLASHIAGARGSGLAYAELLYNDKRAATNNQRFAFSQPASALGLRRVYLLTGPRTCSASEQVINGLRGAGVEVVTVGNTTCGKPVGFLPSSNCGQTYSVVNFESVNERNEGRYFDGFDASCTVAEDFTAAQGGAADPLLAAAGSLADGGACPGPSADGRAQPLAARRAVPRKPEAGERQGMIPR
ncbi:MAG: peptidase S41 [Leptothrix sp. (in: Bacteria)]|nr:peptidase S41 [Leptothrix sp. (in: b-proteobacteria)]